MGVHMSTPMLSKVCEWPSSRSKWHSSLFSLLQDSHDGHDQGLAFGKSSMQGWRMSMEDASIAILDLQPDGRSKQPEPSSLEDRVSFFGVYDGYGGANVSMYAAGNTHNILANQEAFGTGDFEQALKDSFLATDEAIWKGKQTVRRLFFLRTDVNCEHSEVWSRRWRVCSHRRTDYKRQDLCGELL